jgi:hypothetical protein
MENWKKYLLSENQSKVYYWQTARGPWRGMPVEFGVTHVPKAKPRPHGDGKLEEIFEMVRKEKFPDRPSRLNCVFLCDSLGDESYCSEWNGRSLFATVETYKVELREDHGPYKIFKADADIWSVATDVAERSGVSDPHITDLAEEYWKDQKVFYYGEILVEGPPEAIVIIGKK